MKPTATAEKPFKVAFLVRQKNGAIWEAMKKREWNQNDLGKFLGISPQEVGRVLNLKGRLPLFKRRPAKRRKLEEKLMEFTGKTVDELFPEEVYNDEVMAHAKPLELIVERDISQLSLTGGSLLMLNNGRLSLEQRELVQVAQAVLSPREIEIIERRVAGETLLLIGQSLDQPIHPETVRQIERHAYGKMRGWLKLVGIQRFSECA